MTDTFADDQDEYLPPLMMKPARQLLEWLDLVMPLPHPVVDGHLEPAPVETPVAFVVRDPRGNAALPVIGTLSEVSKTLADLYRLKCANVYVEVDTVACRCIVVEFDGTPKYGWPLEPSITIFAGRSPEQIGHYQLVWLLTDDLTTEPRPVIAERMKALGATHAVTEGTALLALPGTYSRRYAKAHAISAQGNSQQDTVERYSPEQIVGAFTERFVTMTQLGYDSRPLS